MCLRNVTVRVGNGEYIMVMSNVTNYKRFHLLYNCLFFSVPDTHTYFTNGMSLAFASIVGLCRMASDQCFFITFSKNAKFPTHIFSPLLGAILTNLDRFRTIFPLK